MLAKLMQSSVALLFFLLPLLTLAQGTYKDVEDKNRILISGSVRNSFTGKGVGNARISVFGEDGTEIHKNVLLLTFGNRSRNGNEFRVSLPQGRFRFHVECDGYKPFDYWCDVDIRRKKMIKLPDFMIQRDFSFIKEVQLGEASVTATKVKMYYNGDTLVYNADAFKLPDGSMLDDLIRQLPGAELKDNGEIYINGRKLDFLLLNGREFFSGNNKVMLENLPYYIVDKLKVYEQQSVRSEALGHQVDEKLYVMDVRVKKEYAVGYLGNVETAGGTHDRYLARLFALRFTDYSRLSVFGGSNNVNESRKPGADTHWSPSENTAGTELRHNGGLDFLLENKLESWKEAANAVVTWTETRTRERSASETFLTEGNTFGRGSSTGVSKNLDLNAYNNFTLKKPFFLDLKSNFNYQNFDRVGESLSASFNAHPDSMGTDTLNIVTNEWMASGNKLEAKQSVQFLRNTNMGDDVEVDAYVRYGQSSGVDFSRYRLRYYSMLGNNDYRHRYNDDNSREYEYAAKGLYRINMNQKTLWEFSYQYKQSDATADRQRYRLEQIAGWEDGNSLLNELPSNRELLQQAMDNENSYNTHIQGKVHRMFTRLSAVVGEHKVFNVSYYVDRLSNRIHYAANPLDTTMMRSEWLHNLEIEFDYRYKNRNRIYYHVNQSSPSMMQLVPVKNTYNPLSITVGNPDLKRLSYHGLYNDFSYRWGGDRKVNTNLDNHMGVRYYQNQVATAVHYDRTTGVYTYRPECVNGNYAAFWYNSLGFQFRNLRQLSLNNGLSYNYKHNVDLYLPDGYERSLRSTVHTHIFSETLKAAYDFGKVQLGVLGKMDYRYAHSQQYGFMDIHAFDVTYGVNMQCQLPWNFNLATDFKVYTRRGYDDEMMNDDDFVWNLSLSRSVLKGKLNFKLQGFDILHNLNNVTYLLNGQGRTETWRRTIPQYWMMHVQWRFNKVPKRRIE